MSCEEGGVKGISDSVKVCICVHACVCVCVCVYACVHAHPCVYVRACVRAACLHEYVLAGVHVCVCEAA